MKVVSTLTSPSIVSFKTLGSDWTVEALLDAVAEAACRGECQALIDTGALVTGLTNKEVAEHLLGLKKRGRLRESGWESGKGDLLHHIYHYVCHILYIIYCKKCIGSQKQ